MIIRQLFLIVLAGMLVACGSSNTVVTTLHNPSSLAKGTVVYLGDEPAGEVTLVTFDGDAATVEIDLTAAHFTLVDRSAVVVQNTMKEGFPLEIHNSNMKIGPIDSGGELRGLDSMLQFGAWSIGDAISVGPEIAANYLSQVQEYLGSQDWEHQKQEVQEQIRSAGDSAQQAVEEVSEELNETVEKLRELEDEAVATSEEMGEQIGQELNEVLEEFRVSGEALAQELEKLAEQLEESDYAREAGQSFLDMLQAMLDGLNRGTGNDTDNPPGSPSSESDPSQDSTVL